MTTKESPGGLTTAGAVRTTSCPPFTAKPGQNSAPRPQAAPHTRAVAFTPADSGRPRVAVYRRPEPDSAGLRAAYWPVVGVLVEHTLDLFGHATGSRVSYAVEDPRTGTIRAAADMAGGPAGLAFLGVFEIGQHPRWTDPVFEVGS